MYKLKKHAFTINFLLMVLLNLSSTSLAKTRVYNVLNFGAKPTGLTDTRQAFLDAWEAACSVEGMAHIVVPKGRYLLNPIDFSGVECKSNDITFMIDGTIVAPNDYRVLGAVDRWVGFDRVSGVTIYGRGTFDAKGGSLWKCKKGKNGDKCPPGATTLTFTNANNVVIKGITSLNCQLFHMVVNVCKNVTFEAIKIIAPGDSPNTDGIHVQVASDVTIKNTVVKTGDDCVSIGPGTKNLWIERIVCGPSHGISIGSLAKSKDEEGVQNVTVKTAVISYSLSGVRIKSWGRPTNGFVKGIVFEDILMRNVFYPIVIDQNYCPHVDINCPGQESGLEINDVTFKHIRGTSLRELAVRIECSATNPCTGIKLEKINLKYRNREAQSYCKNAVGEVLGLVQPKSCLNSD